MCHAHYNRGMPVLSPAQQHAIEALAKMAEERMGVSGAVLREVLASSRDGHSTVTDPSHLFSRYLDAAQKIWEFVDGWSAR